MHSHLRRVCVVLALILTFTLCAPAAFAAPVARTTPLAPSAPVLDARGAPVRTPEARTRKRDSLPVLGTGRLIAKGDPGFVGDPVVAPLTVAVGQKVNFTVKTTLDTPRIAVYEYGGMGWIVDLTSGYTDSGSIRTWSFSVAFKYAGKYTVDINACSLAKIFQESDTFTVQVTGGNPRPAVLEQPAASYTGAADAPVRITLVTTTSVTRVTARELLLFDASMDTVVRSYKDANNERTWTLDITFPYAGQYRLEFYVGDAEDTYDVSKTCNVAITGRPLPDLISANLEEDSVLAGETARIRVTTNGSADMLTVVSALAQKEIFRATTGYQVSGSTRMWTLDVPLARDGEDTLYVRACHANGMPFDDSDDMDITVTPNRAVATVSVTPATAVRLTPMTFTALATRQTTRVKLVDENGATAREITTFTDLPEGRQFKFTHAFGTLGQRNMKLYAGSGAGYAGHLPVRFTITEQVSATIASASVGASQVAPLMPLSFTAVTNLATTRIKLANPNGSAIATITGKYTDSGSVRTWKFQYAFGTLGERTIRLYPGTASSFSNSYQSVSFRVAAGAPAIQSASVSPTNVLPLAPVRFTVVTTPETTVLRLLSESNTKIADIRSGYTDAAGKRTWKFPYYFGTIGARTIKLAAGSGTSFVPSTHSVKFTVSASAPAIRSGSASPATIQPNTATTFTIVTPKGVTRIRMVDESGKQLIEKTSGFTDAGDTRTWKFSFVFGVLGNRTVRFYPGNAAGYTQTAYPVSFTVAATQPAEMISASASPSSILAGEKVTITAVTSKNTTKVKLVAENGSNLGEFTKEYTDGTNRTWKIAYTFGNAGNRSIKLYAGNSTGYAAAYKTATFTVTTATAKYRALLVSGEVLDAESPNFLHGAADNMMNLMGKTLANNTFGGQRYTVATERNTTRTKTLARIQSVLGAAGDGDVSMFYFAGMGGYAYGNAGDVCLEFQDGSTISVDELELALRPIKGTVVVILDASRSGAFIGKGGPGMSDQAFASALAAPFTRMIAKGTLTQSKYKVITSCRTSEDPYQVYKVENSKSLFYATFALAHGGGYNFNGDVMLNSLPADTNKDRVCTLQESISYANAQIPHLSNYKVTQNMQVYPVNDNFALFARN